MIVKAKELTNQSPTFLQKKKSGIDKNGERFLVNTRRVKWLSRSGNNPYYELKEFLFQN